MRTHTIRLLDAPGATMAVTCPAWCTDDHAEEKRHGTFAADFAHRGEEHAMLVPVEAGVTEDLLVIQTHQCPFGGSDLRTPTAVLWPTLGMTECHLGTNGLIDLAEQLRRYADEIEQAVDELHQAVTEHHRARWSA